jgi:hypothetical protein
LTDINEPSGNGKPKRRPSWFRWNFDDFIAETDHLSLTEMGAATRLMGALSRSEDYSLDDDPDSLCKIVRGRSGVRVRWERIKTAALERVLTFKDGRVSCPWLTRKWTQAGHHLDSRWTSATDKPLKNNSPTSPNREYRIYNKEPANAPLKGGGVAVREEASKEEEVERPLTPDERAERLAKFEAFQASKKREAVKQNLGITEGEIQQLTEAYDEHLVDEAEPENDAGGVVA